MEVRVAQSSPRDAIHGRSRDDAAEGAWCTETLAIRHNEQHVGCPLRRHDTWRAHQAFDSEAFSLITPPNLGSGGGSCVPLMVVVALGEPNSPVTCCAM